MEMTSTQRHGGAAIAYLVGVDSTKTRIILFYLKNTSNIPVDDGSSLNIPITVKIIALANVTVIETSVLALYLFIHSLIFNSPLLCTSSWRFEICLPPIYILIAFSPNIIMMVMMIV